MSPQTRIYSTAQVNDSLQVWREQTLQVTLLVTLGAATTPLLIVLRNAFYDSHYRPIALMFLSFYLFLIPLSALRRPDHCLRVWGLLLTGYAAAILSMAQGGLVGSGRVYLIALPIAAIVLQGVYSGIAAVLLSLFVYGGFILTAEQGWLRSWLAHQEGLLTLSDWYTEGMTFAMLLVVSTLLVSLLVRKQARVLARTKQAEAELAAAQRKLLMAREEERRLLSWELHDEVVQYLIALSYRLFNYRDQVEQYEMALAETLEEIRQETLRIMGVVRDACSELRADVLDVEGVGLAIRHHAYELMQKSDVVVYLDMPREEPRLADPLEIALLRIFQEALGNAVKHARVREVWVCFRLEDGKYELRVWDKGCGFTATEPLERRFGLVMMRERMAAVGGHLEVHSALGEGTVVRAWGEINEQ